MSENKLDAEMVQRIMYKTVQGYLTVTPHNALGTFALSYGLFDDEPRELIIDGARAIIEYYKLEPRYRALVEARIFPSNPGRLQ